MLVHNKSKKVLFIFSLSKLSLPEGICVFSVSWLFLTIQYLKTGLYLEDLKQPILTINCNKHIGTDTGTHKGSFAKWTRAKIILN